MPKFDYRCDECQNEFEFFAVRTTDIASCPACSSVNLTKKVSLFTVAKSRLAKPAPAAQSDSESKHTCTSSGKHGTSVHGPGSSHPVGCGVHYADSLRKKYGY